MDDTVNIDCQSKCFSTQSAATNKDSWWVLYEIRVLFETVDCFCRASFMTFHRIYFTFCVFYR